MGAAGGDKRDDTIAQLSATIAQLKATIAQLNATIAQLNAAMTHSTDTNAQLNKTVANQSAVIDALRVELAELHAELKTARGNSQTAPNVPSGQRPPYKKPSSKRRPRLGRKPGHKGTTRARPDSWDREVEHTTTCCPHCDGEVRESRSADGAPNQRERIVEDVVLEEPETVLHKIGQYYCRRCRVRVEPVVTDAMPGDRIGLNVVVLTAVQHFLHGITISRIVELLKHQHGFEISRGALVRSWRRLARYFGQEYSEIQEAIRDHAHVRHADETSWRVAGKTHWLWCFCTKREVYYVIDRSRSSKVVKEVLGEVLDGVLITDFYAAYNICKSTHSQFCIAHLLRELEKTRTKLGKRASRSYLDFEKRLKRLIREALRLHGNNHNEDSRREARRRFDTRLRNIYNKVYADEDSNRIALRLEKRAEGIFTFLDEPGVDPTNNWAETNVRPAVIMRKNSYGNQSEDGADTQAILMSVFRTYKLQDRDVFEAAKLEVQAQIVAEKRRSRRTPTSDS